jgi:3-oxoacyl-(acyl-carrier-protein) synthase/SAM-dependent methyltransferase
MSDVSPTSELSPVKQALLEIRRLRAQLAQRQTAAGTEPIAIVGIAIRFPDGIASLDSLWKVLAAGEHSITGTPADRWDENALYDVDADRAGRTYARHGGFLKDADRFDAELFGITPREAESMDPQHRILLELTWEALEDAGIPATRLSGTRAGVFIGLCNSDYGRMLMEDRDDIDAYSSFGLAISIAAGRISYFLDSKGPSMVVDTACSSALAAVHLACKSLASGESSLAITGASNLMLTPDATISFTHARMLARDGQCKTFDAAADGYVRADGCAIVILKRLSDAVADNDRVYAVIRGSAVNHDGRSAGLTAPNGPAQTAVIQEALRDAKLAAADVDYVEAHGTGTPLGDPIELQALGAAYGEGRAADRKLLVGSIKTNIGHLEAAAGFAGLVKIVLALRHEFLPPHRNFAAPNPRVDWDNLPISVVNKAFRWQRGARPRRAGVSAFGFSGTNVHLLLEEAPLPAESAAATKPSGPDCLFVLSARSEAALRELAARYAVWLDESTAAIDDICRSVATGRSHLRHRLTAIVRDRTELADALRAWLAGSNDGLVKSAFAEQPAPQLGIFCPPLSAADAAATAKALRADSPAFASAWDSFAAAVAPEALDGPAADFDPAQVVALQYALGRFWTLLETGPCAVFGTGVGEIAAASLAGLLSPTDALVRARARPGATPTRAKGTGHFISTRSGRSETVWDDRLQDGRARPRLEDAARAAEAAGAGFLLILGGDGGTAPAAIQQRATLLGQSAEAAWRSVLEGLAARYLADANISWDALYLERGGAGARPKLDLPIYAFQRQRFWRPQTHSRASRLPSQAEVPANWPKAVNSVRLQSESGPLGWDVTTYPTRWRRFEELAAGHAIKTFVELGAFASAGARASTDDLVKRHGIVPLYGRVLNRWLNLLVQEGVLRSDGDAFVSPQPLRERDLSTVSRDIDQLLTDDPDMLGYVRRTSARLKDLLTGRMSPLEVLFPGGSLEMAEGIYERSASARYLNSMVAAAVRSAVEDHRGSEPFRLVEAGAGTGGTTSRLAEFFPSDGEYWFTDLSDVFLGRARRRYEKNPAFRFTKYNLEQPPPPELPVGATDVVLAANVVHATRDVGATIRGLRSLLKPGGLLILLESTLHHSGFDLTIAFVEGWSSFDDKYRVSHPLLSADRWVELLGECGFVEADRFPKSGAAADNIGQHVVLGRNSLVASANVVTSTARTGPAEAPAKVVSAQAAAAVRTGSPVGQDRRKELEQVVRTCAARIMHLDPATRPGPRERFSDLGMDSLMALQLRSDLAEGLGLGDLLPSTIAFDTGTVERLTEELLRLTDSAAGAAPAGQTPVPADRATAPGAISQAALEKFSDDQVEALLAQRVLANEGILER